MHSGVSQLPCIQQCAVKITHRIRGREYETGPIIPSNALNGPGSLVQSSGYNCESRKLKQHAVFRVDPYLLLLFIYGHVSVLRDRKGVDDGEDLRP